MSKLKVSFVLLVSLIILVSLLLFAVHFNLLKNDFGVKEQSQVVKTEPSSPINASEPAIVNKSKPVEKPNPEQVYLDNSQYLNMSNNFGLFETKLLRVGWFETPDGLKFRADIWVKNAGHDLETFRQEDAFIRVIPNQKYNYSGGTFNGINITPGEERSGYILFSGVPYDLKGNITLIIGTSKAYSSIFGMQLYSPHAYELYLE